MKRILKWVGMAAGGLVLVAVGGVLGVSCVSDSRAAERYAIEPDPVVVPAGEGVLEEGRRLYLSRGCGDCHLEDGTGRVMMDDAPGVMVGANLTKLEGYDNVDMVRAIRHGVAKDGRPLLLMPSYEYWHMSDRDLGHILAYIESLPEKDRTLPQNELRPLGKVLHVFGLFPAYPAEAIDHEATRPEPPAVGPTVEYGEYIGIGCIGCHGEGLSGGPIPGAPPELGVPANLTPHETGLASWSEDDFVKLMRTGERPDGSSVDNAQMPYENFAHMTDTELSALWAYLQTVEPREEGNR